MKDSLEERFKKVFEENVKFQTYGSYVCMPNLLDFIHTELSALLDRVEEEVIGEDFTIGNFVTPLDQRKNEVLADQRKKLIALRKQI